MGTLDLERRIFDADHDAFRETARRFAERDVLPYLEQWAAAGQIDRDVFRKAGELGLLGVGVGEEFGGGGIDDFRFNAIVIEELAAIGATAVVMSLSGINDLVVPYFLEFGTAEQNHRLLAPMVAGEKIGAIAMTEPGAGSDLAAMATTAIPDGADSFILKGSKTFISNGMLADTIIVVAKTNPAAGRKGVSLLVVEADMPGFTRNALHGKVGLAAQDTAELVFDDVRVPRANLLGEENAAWGYLRHNLAQERLSIAVTAMASMRRTFESARQHAVDRSLFGKRLADLQTTRFYLAELATEIEIAQTFIDRCILDASGHQLDEVTAAMAKWWVTELHAKVIHRAVQLHGGYGYMTEYQVARDYLDSRVETIYGGATEVMKEIIGRRLVSD